MKDFGQRLKDLRLEHNISQTELSKATGLSQATIAKYETGDRTPSADCLIALAKYFKCTSDYLLGLEEF